MVLPLVFYHVIDGMPPWPDTMSQCGHVYRPVPGQNVQLRIFAKYQISKEIGTKYVRLLKTW